MSSPRRRRAGGGGPDDGPTPGSPAAESPPADPVDVARAIVLRQLTVAPRTRAELAQALARRGVPEEAAATVLERFTEVGLIDDSAYATAWVESRHSGRGLARRALGHELRRRGVPEPEVAAALDTLDPERERATARALVDRRLAGTAALDPQARTRRLVGQLVRKGYPPGMAYAVVREALAELGQDAAIVASEASPDD